MKLLLDESVPRPLGTCVPERFEIYTVQQMGWTGRSNGELLRLAADDDFAALITADQGIEYQQNLQNLTIPVVVLIAHRTRYQELQPLIHRVVDIVIKNPKKIIYRVRE